MKKIIIDGNYMKTKEKTHMYLKKKLKTSAYYGNNLDALWDCLSVYSESLLIELINKEKTIGFLGSYGRDLINLFKEVEEENSNITFTIKDNFK